MDISKILKKSFTLTWRYSALWFFGFLLALTVNNMIWLGFPNRDEAIVVENRIILPNEMILRFPGEGLTIDLHHHDGPVVKIEGYDPDWYKHLSYQKLPFDLDLSDLRGVLASIGIVVSLCILMGNLFRYTSEAALMRMVDETERSGTQVSLRQGLRMGWSRTAWKLFLIDFFISLVLFLAFGLILFVVVSPFFLFNIESISDSVPAVVSISVISLGGFALFAFLAFAAGLILSITRPVMRRACALDGHGVWSSIRQGFRLLRTRFDKVALTWLVWLAVRLGWMIVIIPVMVILIPLLLMTIVIGVLAAGLPTLLATWIASYFVGPIFAWAIGVIFGIPLFFVVAMSPLFFLSGLVEVLKSSLWTLAYREFTPLEAEPVQEKLPD